MSDPPTRFFQHLAAADRAPALDALADEVARTPALLPLLLDLALDGDRPPLRARAADVVEKATRLAPAPLAPHRRRLLRAVEGLTPTAAPPAVRWHLAQLIARLPLTPRERARAADALHRLLVDPSALVHLHALQALADLARQDPALEPRVRPALEAGVMDPRASVRARAHRLLAEIAAG